MQSGSGADKAGITEGSLITAINGTPVTSATALTRLMLQYNPGDKVDVAWTDASGSWRDQATLTLGSGLRPPDPGRA